MSSLIQKPAPDFEAEAVVGYEFKTIKLSSFRGKHVVLFFYPLDFTFVCPTEIITFDEKLEEFRKRNAEVIGVSVDSKFSHLAWNKKSRKEGGLGGVRYPIVADITKAISRSYGVLVEEGPDAGVALRGTFVIDKNGIVRHATINDLPLGRNIDEYLRLIDAIDYHEKYGEVCPANWQPGQEGMKPDPVASLAYFEKHG
ncbi:MAG: peroxiredoxin [Deltaproteobacteria bacterium]|nr:peroxiredoxin [Deltaproteobacteria bacterium]MDW8245666.1 peroxiredoxin [Sandaracinaceae bacterium]